MLLIVWLFASPKVASTMSNFSFCSSSLYSLCREKGKEGNGIVVKGYGKGDCA